MPSWLIDKGATVTPTVTPAVTPTVAPAATSSHHAEATVSAHLVHREVGDFVAVLAMAVEDGEEADARIAAERVADAGAVLWRQASAGGVTGARAWCVEGEGGGVGGIAKARSAGA